MQKDEMYWSISTRKLIEVALTVGWTSDLSRATKEAFRIKWSNLNEASYKILYNRLLEAWEVEQEFRPKTSTAGQRRWKLVDNSINSNSKGENI